VAIASGAISLTVPLMCRNRERQSRNPDLDGLTDLDASDVLGGHLGFDYQGYVAGDDLGDRAAGFYGFDQYFVLPISELYHQRRADHAIFEF
jgi:hypothetical protein